MFIGREKETAALLRAVGRGEHVIVSGKFGMGRTSLVRHAAGLSQNRLRFVFVDFSLSANKACDRLTEDLLPRVSRKQHPLKYKTARFKLIHDDLADPRQQIIVLDNVAKLTAQKFEFIRCLRTENRFLFVAIVEHFLSSESVLRLRGMLFPSMLIELGYLSAAESVEYFKQAGKLYRMNLAENQLKHLATMAGGYPLTMTETVERIRNRTIGV